MSSSVGSYERSKDKTGSLEIPLDLHLFPPHFLLHQWINLEVYFMMIQFSIDGY